MGIEKKGRVAVVTGGAAGLGAAYAERLAEDGADVAIGDIADGEAAAARVKSHGRRAFAGRCDVSDLDSVHRFTAAVLDAFGHVDILVNNAGIYPMAPFEKTDPALWHRVFGVNIHGAYHMCRELIPGMAARHYGRVLNVASRTVWIPSTDYTAYIAAKSAVIGLSRALATEYGDKGITVNTLAPGLTRTEGNEKEIEPERFALLAARQAIKRPETPADLVGAVSFLTSDDAAFITGQTLLVDGGMIRL